MLLWRKFARPIPKYNLEMAKSSKLEMADGVQVSYIGLCTQSENELPMNNHRLVLLPR